MLGLVGSLLGNVASGVMGMFGQKSANDANMEMDSTKYQRASADMQAAGLNPMMMFGHGNASVPPTMQNTMAAPAAAAKDAASSAAQQLIAQKTIDQLTEQIAKTNAETANVKAGTPGVGARSTLDVMQSDAIKRIPPSIRIPIYQGGFGADQFKSLGKTGAGLGAAVASAKGVSTALPRISISPPDFSTAKSVIRKRANTARRFDEQDAERAASARAAWRRWWNGSPSNTTTVYKQ